MKPDDFENRLEQQPLRQVPAEWRADILAAAQARRPEFKTCSEETAGWRWLFARFPVAWGSLAMLWAALIAVNLLLFAPEHRTGEPPVLAVHAESLAIWNLQRAELSLLNDEPAETTEPRSVNPPRPRSERRRGEGSGAFLTEPRTDFLT